MKTVLAALLCLAWMASEVGTITVGDDRGGFLNFYIEKTERFRRSGERVRIMGRCDSACTLYLSLPRVCVGPNARLGFHQASRPDGNPILLSYYPRPIRDWLDSVGGLPPFSSLVVLQGEALRRLVPPC